MFEAICILLGEEYDWKLVQNMLKDVNKFLNETILKYDKDNIPSNRIEKLSNFID